MKTYTVKSIFVLIDADAVDKVEVTLDLPNPFEDGQPNLRMFFQTPPKKGVEFAMAHFPNVPLTVVSR